MENFYTLILNDVVLQGKLCLAFMKSYNTIRRWALDKNELLLIPKAQKIINEHIEGDYKEFLEIVIPVLDDWKEKKQKQQQ